MVGPSYHKTRAASKLFGSFDAGLPFARGGFRKEARRMHDQSFGMGDFGLAGPLAYRVWFGMPSTPCCIGATQQPRATSKMRCGL